MEELKSCPFCGGKATLKATNKSCVFTIWCECECGARTEKYYPYTNKEDDVLENIERGKEMAIKSWNRRANNDKIDCYNNAADAVD